jgi:hypothetical protein
MQRLEVSCAVRLIYTSLGAKRLRVVECKHQSDTHSVATDYLGLGDLVEVMDIS